LTGKEFCVIKKLEMVKKDIYEHLADIYLDASSKKKKTKNAKLHLKTFKNLFFISITIIFFLTTLLMLMFKDKYVFTSLRGGKPIGSELALVLEPDIVRINFNFDPVKEEIYSVNLNGLDLVKFKALGFSVRKANYNDNVILKVEFTDNLKRKSEIYLNDIPAFKWRGYKIGFGEFKDINDWSGILSLAFIVEERNIKQKRGVVYLDNIRFLR